MLLNAGETSQKLTQLNVGRTEITNAGVKSLCFGDDFTTDDLQTFKYRCPDLIVLDASETRVTAEGKGHLNIKILLQNLQFSLSLG